MQTDFMCQENEEEDTSIQDSVDGSIQRLGDYIYQRGGRLITAIRNNSDNTSINRTDIAREQKWKENSSSNKGNLTRENLDMAKKRKL